MSEFIKSAVTQFNAYKKNAEAAIAQLPDDRLHWQYNEESNSIAALMKHLHGNMMSRWTDFLTSDGEKEWRERDAEFESAAETRDELMALWDEGWQCLFDAIEPLTEKQLNQDIFIRNKRQSAMDAIVRQLMHYAMHIGQIIYIVKMIQDNQWETLSIARNQSKTFNDKHFSQPKGEETFGLDK